MSAGVICVVLGTVFLSLCGIVMAALRNSLGYLFVDDKDVVAMVAVIAPIAAVYQFPDGILGTTNGVLRYNESCCLLPPPPLGISIKRVERGGSIGLFILRHILARLPPPPPPPPRRHGPGACFKLQACVMIQTSRCMLMPVSMLRLLWPPGVWDLVITILRE